MANLYDLIAERDSELLYSQLADQVQTITFDWWHADYQAIVPRTVKALNLTGRDLTFELPLLPEEQDVQLWTVPASGYTCDPPYGEVTGGSLPKLIDWNPPFVRALYDVLIRLEGVTIYGTDRAANAYRNVIMVPAFQGKEGFGLAIDRVAAVPGYDMLTIQDDSTAVE